MVINEGSTRSWLPVEHPKTIRSHVTVWSLFSVIFALSRGHSPLRRSNRRRLANAEQLQRTIIRSPEHLQVIGDPRLCHRPFIVGVNLPRQDRRVLPVLKLAFGLKIAQRRLEIP